MNSRVWPLIIILNIWKQIENAHNWSKTFIIEVKHFYLQKGTWMQQKSLVSYPSKKET